MLRDPSSSSRRLLVSLCFAVIPLFANDQSAAAEAGARDASPARTAAARIPLAVLGDSDSQGYQDLPNPQVSPVARGGEYHAATFQWTEALAALRGDEFDLGEWGVHGMSGRVAIALEWLGLARAAESHGWEVRAPIKRDHRYNFAYSGDGCADLYGGWSRQVPRLIRLMDGDAQKWRSGIVLIRIGGNDFGNDPYHLGLLAKDPGSAIVRGRMDTCIGEIQKAVAAIHGKHPEIRVVLVGAFNNANWARYFDQWQSAEMQANISKGLDYFDEAMLKMAKADRRIAFFSDRQWFEGIWGSRDAAGRPRYRTFTLGPLVRVTNTEGDAPSNATMVDGHAGLVWNVLWAQALVHFLDSRFGLQVPPITDEDLLRFVLSTGAFQPKN